jgi:hypothetical protein
MEKVTVDAKNKQEAIKQCQQQGWTPDAVRKVDSGGKEPAYMCFESASDAQMWDKQK